MLDTIGNREEMLRLQQLLLPATLPAIGCTEAAAAYRADNSELRLGGDWFDLIDRPDSHSVAAVVGDVVGHGVHQIGVMGQLRAASNALAHSLDGPAEIMCGLDKFAATLDGAAFTTLSIVVFDGTGSASICSAGHPPPVVVRADGAIETIELGRRASLTLGRPGDGDARFPLNVGDLVVLYTDGVVERAGTPIDEAIAALGEFVNQRRHAPCHVIASAVVDEFGVDAQDDQAVLVLRPLHHRGPDYVLETPTPSVVS